MVLLPGGGGDTLAADEIGAVKFQRIKLVFGPDGVSRGDVEEANPYPVFLATVTTSGVNILAGSQIAIASINGNVGVSGTVAATQSGIWAFVLTAGSQVAIASINGNVGISGNIGATQSGIWTVGITPGGQVAIASVNGNIGVSGTVGATLSGINFIIATLSTGTSTIGGTYDVSRRIINERGAVVIASDSFVNATSTGNTEVVPAQGATIIVRVLSSTVMSSADQLVKFQSATTDISASYPVVARGGWHMAYNPHGHFQTRPNEALNINLSVATQTGCNVSWCTTN